ncbi:MAG: hypothetical protein AAB726_02645 [Patescibacteria group bacterium]
MSSWKRITLVIFVLIGGFASFGYWSISQFDSAFDSLDKLSASYVADTRSVYSSLKQNLEMEIESASTSPEVSEISEVLETTEEPATTTPTSSSTDTDADVDLGLFFTFPQGGDEVYIGCNYQISWQSSTAINSLETALIDDGIREPMGPIASGLAKENIFKTDSQNLGWKVGVVWPGSYYIKISKINGVEAEIRSKVFEIKKIPEGISAEDKVNICKKTR